MAICQKTKHQYEPVLFTILEVLNVIARQLLPLGTSILALEGSQQYDVRRAQSATERSQNLSDLTSEYPALLPSATLLPGLALTSEVVTEVTFNHDPIVSELLAFGQAIDLTAERRGVRTVPIAAVAGGAAGEVVRLVLLSKEQIGWEDSKNVKLSSFTAKDGEEGWWTEHGSPIQQLVFADMEDEVIPWLAVRHGGAISILQPLLRREVVVPDYARPEMLPHPPSRLDPHHIVTLPVQRSGGVAIVDVTFNRWNNQQIATLDQYGRWAIWNIEAQSMRRRIWTINESVRGTMVKGSEQDHGEPRVIADGWGAVLWAGDTNTIVVSNRTALVVYDIKDEPEELPVPNNLSQVSTDWILDVKSSPSDLNQIFVLTTSSISWLHISTVREEDDSKKSESGARCLLSWRHFRDSGDVSLRLNITHASQDTNPGEDLASQYLRIFHFTSANAHSPTALIVLLYSRLRNLITVYNLEHSTSSPTQCSSASDPHILNLPRGHESPESETGASDLGAEPQISAMVLKTVPYDSPYGSTPSGLGKLYTKNNIHFYQLSTLFNDSAVLESVYAAVYTTFTSLVHPPDLRTRKDVAKTPVSVSDEFVVPDGTFYGQFLDPEEFNERPSTHQRTKHSEQEIWSESKGLDLDPWTINFEWLEKDVHEVLSERARTKQFDEVLEMLYAEIENMLILGNPTVETLLHLANTVVSVVDIDKASTDLTTFLGDVTKTTIDDENAHDDEKAKSVSISPFLTMPIQRALALDGQVQLSQIYDGLIKAWITPLSLRIPGRARIALEKLLRDIAAQMSLASHQVHFLEVQHDGGPPDDEPRGTSLLHALPVRRKVSTSNLRKGKEPAARSSSPLASSQISEDAGFMSSSQLPVLPTPEPMPSLHSQSSISSLAALADPASRRLQAYCNLPIQPTLPTKMSNLLSRWEVGGDPANYDWEAAQQASLTEESEDESRAKQRQRTEKRRKRQRQDTAGPSSQPRPKRFGGSQPQLATETQGSSQQTQKMVTHSQIEPGPFGGRPSSRKKKKKFGFQGKKPGF